MSFVARQYMSNMEEDGRTPYESNPPKEIADFLNQDSSPVVRKEETPEEQVPLSFKKYFGEEEKAPQLPASFGKYFEEKQKPPIKEAFLSTVKEPARHIARTGVNLATLVAGIPGSLLSLPYAAINAGLEAGTGKEQTPYEESLLGKILPTSAQLKEGARQEFPEMLRPHTQVENFVDNVLEDTALLWNPWAKASQASKIPTSVKNLAKAIGANLGGEVVEGVTGSPTVGNVTKSGLLFLTSILDRPSVKKQVSSLYNEAEQAIPKGAEINVRPMVNKLNGISDRITKGRPAANLSENEKWVLSQVGKVQRLVKNGKISPQQAWAQKRSLNEELQKKIYEVPWSQRKGVRNHAKNVNRWLDEALDKYGKSNPEFGKPFKAAEEAFGTLARSNLLSTWVKDNIKSSPLTHAAAYLFGGGVLSGAGAAIPAYQVAKMVYRVTQSPTLAKLYGNAIKAAAKENGPLFAKYFNELDKTLHEEGYE